MNGIRPPGPPGPPRPLGPPVLGPASPMGPPNVNGPLRQPMNGPTAARPLGPVNGPMVGGPKMRPLGPPGMGPVGPPGMSPVGLKPPLVNGQGHGSPVGPPGKMVSSASQPSLSNMPGAVHPPAPVNGLHPSQSMSNIRQGFPSQGPPAGPPQPSPLGTPGPPQPSPLGTPRTGPSPAITPRSGASPAPTNIPSPNFNSLPVPAAGQRVSTPVSNSDAPLRPPAVSPLGGISSPQQPVFSQGSLGPPTLPPPTPNLTNGPTGAPSGGPPGPPSGGPPGPPSGGPPGPPSGGPPGPPTTGPRPLWSGSSAPATPSTFGPPSVAQSPSFPSSGRPPRPMYPQPPQPNSFHHSSSTNSLPPFSQPSQTPFSPSSQPPFSQASQPPFSSNSSVQQPPQFHKSVSEPSIAQPPFNMAGQYPGGPLPPPPGGPLPPPIGSQGQMPPTGQPLLGGLPGGPLPPTGGLPGGPLPPTGGLHGGPPPPMGGGMPPLPSGQRPPMPGMPPMPPSSGTGMPPMPSGQHRFGGDMGQLGNKLGGLSVTNTGFQKMWGQETLDLLQNRHILPGEEVVPPKVKLQAEQWNGINCARDIFRCTLTKIPETDSLLKKARLPLGILIHPYKDLSHLPVIQCSTIVRCRSCRTYINPFVHFVDQRRWRCNLCYRVNELPEEFLYDPVSKSYGDPSRRPECKSSTIEFIAPQEYMLRPPQPAVYLFLLDVSRQAVECGYLRNFCDILLDELDKLPGDSRTQVGFITYDRTLQFYMIPEGASQASQLIVGDIDDVFLPSPSDLLINLQACKEQIIQMLNDLPEMFNGSQETDNCLGAALQAAYKMVSPTGGRITVLQCTLPNIGPGALKSREGAQTKEGNDTALLGPTTDFYKKLALECSGQQVAVDCFVLANQHVDLATISGISKFSGGQVTCFPGYHNHLNLTMAEKFERAFRRYLSRKIGFESVMRIRCTRGMSLHTFHGHFFVRSTDLLSLPNVNPDAGFGMQVSIDEDLKDSREVSFQAALLYTSSKGERRIRVHTLCIPISSSLQEIIQGADQQCIVGLLAKMAVDRSLNSSLSDAKEAFINACVDIISRWKMIQCISQPGVLPVNPNLSLFPLYTLALLKSSAFSARSGIKLDERTNSLIEMKCLPLTPLIQSIYPDLYRVDHLDQCPTQEDEDGVQVPAPERLQLSAENVSLSGVYLLDKGDIMYLYLGKLTSQLFCEKIFGVTNMTEVDENLLDVPELENEDSERFRSFLQFLNNKRSHTVPLKIVRDDQKDRMLFISHLVDDRSESSFSYYEFLQHLKTQIK